MIVLPDILSSEELEFCREFLAISSFVDGKLTAQGTAQQVKNNEQLQRTQETATELDAVLMAAISRNPMLAAWAQPMTISIPLINRHGPGMHYGFHVDAPITTHHSVMRRDISISLFLSDPDSYQGGELEVESPAGLQRIKLPAGHGYAYATHALHQVCPVTSGTRLAAVFWLQSVVPDDQMRQTLFELHAVTAALTERGLDGQEMLLLSKIHQNLTRKFSRP
jgi:PKHD-type hydroxylase